MTLGFLWMPSKPAQSLPKAQEGCMFIQHPYWILPLATTFQYYMWWLVCSGEPGQLCLCIWKFEYNGIFVYKTLPVLISYVFTSKVPSWVIWKKSSFNFCQLVLSLYITFKSGITAAYEPIPLEQERFGEWCSGIYQLAFGACQVLALRPVLCGNKCKNIFLWLILGKNAKWALLLLFFLFAIIDITYNEI